MKSPLAQLRWADARRRVRASVGGETIVDSRAARVVWEPFRVVGFYAVPRDDITVALTDPVDVVPAESRPPVLTPEHAFAVHTTAGTSWTIPSPTRALEGAGFTPHDRDLDGYVFLDWAAFDGWREEDQEVLSHPHDPFHRIDCLTSGRHVTVTVDGVVVADTTSSTLLLETNLPPRFYIPQADARMDLLTASPTRSTCAYKGHASYFSARIEGRTVPDVAWTYHDPLTDGLPVRDQLCFYDDRTHIVID